MRVGDFRRRQVKSALEPKPQGDIALPQVTRDFGVPLAPASATAVRAGGTGLRGEGVL
ncbi:hypothetical protein GCM10010174_68740 [Kutzneria viridogrisea]